MNDPRHIRVVKPAFILCCGIMSIAFIAQTLLDIQHFNAMDRM